MTTLWMDDLKQSFYSKRQPVDVLDPAMAKQARLTLIARFIAFNKPSVLTRIKNIFWKDALFDFALKSDLHKHESGDVNIRILLSENGVEPSPLMFLSSDRHSNPYKIVESKYILDNQNEFWLAGADLALFDESFSWLLEICSCGHAELNRIN